jgi:hypothetical protein
MPPTILPHPSCPRKKSSVAFFREGEAAAASSGEALQPKAASHWQPPPAARQLVTLLSCYMTGSTEGRNLGTPGYSHDFVANAYAPLLARHGEVRVVPDAKADLDRMVDAVLAEGKLPLHFSILPLQDVVLARRALNVAVPAWEYPDVPNHAFDGNAQNDWPQTADRCDMVLVSGPFTHEALRRGGAVGAIRMVQVPVEDGYFNLPLWQPGQTRTLDCRAFVFTQPRPAVATNRPLRRRESLRKQIAKDLEESIRETARRLLGGRFTAAISAGLRRLKSRRIAARTKGGRPTIKLPYESVSQVDLSGVVYTSIFNPDDGRKNWPDLINGFLLALGDREDATLVLKLITSRAASVDHVIRHIFNRGIEFRCRLVVICDFLNEHQLHQLAEATTYYLQASRAEGNCLPLMNHLAAGRPGISPDHSSMSDYFGPESGFVVESHPEPAAWPHEKRQRLLTTWGRIVWTSLRDQIRASYALAKNDPTAYAALGRSSRRHMRAWAGREAVTQRLDAALDEVIGLTRGVVSAAAEQLDERRSANRQAA